MSTISENIRFMRRRMGLTQEQFSAKIGIKRSLLGAYEEARAEPRLELLQEMARQFGTTVDKLIGTDLRTGKEKFVYQHRPKEVVVVTMDLNRKENIEWVPVKAAAGYLNGFADPEYIKELPRFRLPMLSGPGPYRAFEITGDSMLPLLPGTLVVGEYIEDLRDVKNGKTYVLVTEREGIVYKRVFNYLGENGKLFLVSDNRQYSPYQINGEEVIEAWAAKAYISVQFPDVESSQEVSVEQLASIVLDLQKELHTLKATKRKKK
jgi:transcriptional regulator with XRE-family HTH domain